MPGYLGSPLKIAGTKIINGNTRNPARGLPRASGLTLLYDDASARIVCVMEGAYLSSLRTASVTALATDLLQSAEIERMAIIGAGELARAHIELLVQRLPRLRDIYLFDLLEERVSTLQRIVAPVLQTRDVGLHPTASAEAAIQSAQLIVPVTTTTVGYIPLAWLQPGALLVNISLDDPLPEVVLQADKVIVDDWNLVKNDTRRLIGRMYHAGLIAGPDEPAAVANQRRRIDAQLGEIIVGAKEGRQDASEIILVNPFGLAIEDVALAAQVYQVARTLRIGTPLER